MQKREWDFVDMTTWGEGAWQDEPDKVQWEDTKTKLPCLAVRNPTMGHWCGYVGVAEEHPLFSVDYGSCPVRCEETYCTHRPESILDAHGGITFSGFCQEDKEFGICHIPDEGEPDKVWWFGFDCAHVGDLSPGVEARLAQFTLALGKPFLNDKYRTLSYIKDECTRFPIPALIRKGQGNLQEAQPLHCHIG